MINRLFDGSLMPHGHCLLWRSDLLLLHIGGDLLTFIAYAIIPITLIYFVKKREDLNFDWMWLMFAAFIASCGVSHFLGIINIWHGYYFLEGLFKLSTGVISIVTAIMLWRLMPLMLSVPSAKILSQRNDELYKARLDLEEVNKTLEERIQQRTAQLEKLASTDSLTGLENRRSIMNFAEQERSRSIRYKHPFSILIIDIDFFKKVNDNYGHQIGDNILLGVSKILMNTCRQSDHVGRYGGEEFLVILPETHHKHAADLAERIRLNVESEKFEIDMPITCSIGTAVMIDNESLSSLIKHADDAVYSAKKNGRNTVVSWQEK